MIELLVIGRPVIPVRLYPQRHSQRRSIYRSLRPGTYAAGAACPRQPIAIDGRHALTKGESGVQFLALVLRHVLPEGFGRARHFDFLHPNRKPLIALLRR